jgi:hypothetical protein
MAKIRRNATLPAASTQCLCDESYVITAVVLPVKLLNFKAASSGGRVNIIWKVADESAGVKYEIQRGADGISFESIKEINVLLPANGEYSFTDNQLPATGNKLFYRLKITEPNGNIKFSEINVINVNDIPHGLSISPNSSSGSIKAKFYSPLNEAVHIMLYNSEGRKVKEWNKGVIKGINSIILDGLDSLADGMYIIKIESINNHLQQKFYMLK